MKVEILTAAQISSLGEGSIVEVRSEYGTLLSVYVCKGSYWSGTDSENVHHAHRFPIGRTYLVREGDRV